MGQIIAALLLVVLGIPTSAAIQFEDTSILFKGRELVFSPLPSANAFVHKSANLEATIVRQKPSLPVNANSVEKVWQQNLKVIGTSPSDPCRKITRFHYICKKIDKEQVVYLSYSRRDLAVVVLKGKDKAAAAVEFRAVKR